MAEQKESSVLFSLKELMNLEEDRIREEEAEKAKRIRADFEAKEAAERASRDAEERRLREEEERRRAEELRKREEAARLEAIRHAEIEKAKADVEHRSRLETMAQQQAHEAQLASINQDEHKKKLQITIGVVAFILVAAVVGGGIAFKKHNDQANLEKAALEARAQAAEQEKDRLEDAVKQSEQKEADLKSALNNAKDEADRARIQAELQKAQETTKAAQKGLRSAGSSSSGSSGSSSPKPKAACNCTPGDPLCSCF